MKKTKSGRKYIPEYVFVDGKEVMFRMLSTEQRFAVMSHCKTAHSVESRPNYKDIVVNSMSIMKFGGGFTGDEILSMKERYSKNGFIIQPLVKEAHGGGQGARGWGILHLSVRNLVDDLLKKYDILEEFHGLSKEKQLSRIQKFIGPMDVIEFKPKVAVSSILPYEGLVYAKQEWMDKNNIPFGAKTTGPVKGLIVPLPDYFKIDADFIVPESENKINLSVEKLSKTVMLNRENVPANRYSKNLITVSGKVGRMPRHAFDLQAHLDYIPNVDLSVERAFYETGNFTPDFIDSLFGYNDTKTGEHKLRNEGKLIMAGVHPFSRDMIEGTLKSLWTMVRTKLEGRIPGIYGTAMPLEMLPKGISIKRGYITRFPWIFPILTEYAIYEHCIFLSQDLMKIFGGDFDGDQVAAYHRMTMKDLPVWPRDKEWLVSIMAAPEKKEAVSDKSIEEVIGSQIDQYVKCGQVYNICRILEECVRMEGWKRKAIFELGAKLTSQIVQPYINGFKYMAEEGNVPTIEVLAEKYGVPMRWKERAVMFFNAFRSSKASIPRIAHVARLINAKPDSLMYYERLAYKFITWNLCDEGLKNVKL